jgi:glucose-6-phosphate 1-dehydrogenase
MAERIPSTTLVIFGISGDLSRRYLLPALADICKSSNTESKINILGLSRRPISVDDVIEDKTKSLLPLLEVIQLEYDQSGAYRKLRQKLDELNSEQVIFYLAVPSEAVLPIVTNLGEAGLNTAKFRLLLEKPFGNDLASSEKLVSQTRKYFKEDQLYRIDHYLAKEMSQNIAVFLGSNALFRDVWRNDFIDYIEIVAAETIGIEGRVQLWESTGALRDFLQSHLLQLAALTLMEPCPHDFDFSDLPKRRLAALRLLELPADLKSSVFRAQYEGYRSEVNNPESTSETFVALQLNSKDPRWEGVPIYLACGKKLDQRLTQIRINFKKDNESEANMLVIRIQPKEGIELDLWVKQPGYDRRLQKKTLSFLYEQDFSDRLPNAYEQIIFDAIRERHSLFASSDEVLESWKILQPVLDHWKENNIDLSVYKSGSSVEQILN